MEHGQTHDLSVSWCVGGRSTCLNAAAWPRGVELEIGVGRWTGELPYRGWRRLVGKGGGDGEGGGMLATPAVASIGSVRFVVLVVNL